MRSLPSRRIALGLALVAIALAARGARGQDPASLLPPGAHAVVATEDLAGFWDRLTATQLYASVAALPRARAGAASLDGVRKLLDLFGPRGAVGFYGTAGERPDAGEPGAGLDAVAVTDVADPALARAALAAIEARLSAEHGLSFSGERLAGTGFRVARDSSGNERFVWALVRNRVVVGKSRARFADALELAAGREAAPSMAADAGWSAARGRVAPAPIVAWIDFDAVRGAVDRRREIPAEAFGGSLALGLRWMDTGLRGDAHLTFAEGAKGEFAAAMAAAPGPVRSLEMSPATTLVLLATASLDADRLLAGIRRGVRMAAGRDSSAADSSFAARIARFEARSGIDVEDELLPAVGREVALTVTGVDRGFLFPVPRIAFLIEVRDEVRARSILDKVEALTATELRERRSIPLSWQGETYEGTTIRYAPTPLGESIEPSYVLADGYVFVGTSRDAVKTALDVRAGRAPSLAESPAFSVLRAFLPAESSGVTYVDIAGLAAQAREIAAAYGWMGGEEGAAASILGVLDNAPRLGMWSEADGEGGVWWRGLLEVR